MKVKERFRCYEAKIEESEKAGSHRESNPGHLACAASALPLTHNPLYVLQTAELKFTLECIDSLTDVLRVVNVLWL